MDNNTSLDPRVNRLPISEQPNELSPDQSIWVTWEVFHQEKKGKQPVHAGIVHAPAADMALLFAKEQYARRGKTTNLWVVKTSDVHTFSDTDDDIFATTPEKTFRDPAYYKVRDRIEAFKKKNNITT
jgi:ring-1,2-phenylacetyl-CoA epoxidase subunit PaaB